jgi:hypothetical protein
VSANPKGKPNHESLWHYVVLLLRYATVTLQGDAKQARYDDRDDFTDLLYLTVPRVGSTVTSDSEGMCEGERQKADFAILFSYLLF